MATTCEQCGTSAVTGATTCRRCGATLPPEGAIPAPPTSDPAGADDTAGGASGEGDRTRGAPAEDDRTRRAPGEGAGTWGEPGEDAGTWGEPGEDAGTWGEVGPDEGGRGEAGGGGAGGAGPAWGEPSGGAAPHPPAPRGSTGDHNLGLLAHLSAYAAFVGLPPFVGPLVVWLWQREKDPFVEAHAREALNFNISVLIYAVAGSVLAAIVAVITFGIAMFAIVPAAVVFAIAWFVLTLLAGLAAGRGEPYRYPLTIRFVR